MATDTKEYTIKCSNFYDFCKISHELRYTDEAIAADYYVFGENSDTQEIDIDVSVDGMDNINYIVEKLKSLELKSEVIITTDFDKEPEFKINAMKEDCNND